MDMFYKDTFKHQPPIAYRVKRATSIYFYSQLHRETIVLFFAQSLFSRYLTPKAAQKLASSLLNFVSTLLGILRAKKEEERCSASVRDLNP